VPPLRRGLTAARTASLRTDPPQPVPRAGGLLIRDRPRPTSAHTFTSRTRGLEAGPLHRGGQGQPGRPVQEPENDRHATVAPRGRDGAEQKHRPEGWAERRLCPDARAAWGSSAHRPCGSAGRPRRMGPAPRLPCRGRRNACCAPGHRASAESTEASAEPAREPAGQAPDEFFRPAAVPGEGCIGLAGPGRPLQDLRGIGARRTCPGSIRRSLSASASGWGVSGLARSCPRSAAALRLVYGGRVCAGRRCLWSSRRGPARPRRGPLPPGRAGPARAADRASWRCSRLPCLAARAAGALLDSLVPPGTGRPRETAGGASLLVAHAWRSLGPCPGLSSSLSALCRSYTLLPPGVLTWRPPCPAALSLCGQVFRWRPCWPPPAARGSSGRRWRAASCAVSARSPTSRARPSPAGRRCCSSRAGLRTGGPRQWEQGLGPLRGELRRCCRAPLNRRY